ncbi:MAG: alpha-ketoglutarate-dependent dioxygenase AlkB [Alphaproteobacteria bacterium]|nr:alpha-ketoglutarate-dependent dioxygenase AlkB [Alphaproteobacteria bacterium]
MKAERKASTEQPGLFETMPDWPEGLVYRDDVLSPDEESRLAERLGELPFQAFQFHGFEGNRRTVSFGLHYAFDGSGLRAAEPVPGWLHPVRAKAAEVSGLPPEALEHVLVVEYGPGAGIGWHRDRSVFGDVVGLSLLAPARLRFRRKTGDRWERKAVMVAPRSAYVLRGPARSEWEHSITPMEVLRYSLTFRTLRVPPRDGEIDQL